MKTHESALHILIQIDYSNHSGSVLCVCLLHEGLCSVSASLASERRMGALEARMWPHGYVIDVSRHPPLLLLLV